MKIVSYIHPISTYLPCTGIGRHINQILLRLNERKEVNLKLFFSQQWLEKDNKLKVESPLRELPYLTFPNPENRTERNWKIFDLPKMDRYIPNGTDWLYAPMQTYIPVSKCPVAITLHDIQAFETKLPWSNTWQHKLFRLKWTGWIYRALKKCRVIFTVSEFSKQRMIDLLNADPQKLVVIGNGVDQSFFDIAKINPISLPRPVDETYILIIGGLRYKKGADSVLAVAKELQQRKSELKIVVTGDSEPIYVNEVRNYPNLTLLGKVSDEQLPLITRAASSLLFLSPYEGFGIPALEAMAAGIPAIVANKASLPEVVGDAGIVINPEATDAIVDALIELDHNLHLRNKYIQLGQKHATQYTWSRCVDRLITAFKQFA